MQPEHFQPAMPERANLRMLIKSVVKPWPRLLKVVAESKLIKGVPSASSTAPMNMWMNRGNTSPPPLSMRPSGRWGGCCNDLDAIAQLDFLCDDIGLDTISTGVAIAVAMDAGYKEFGDAEAAIEMVEDVAKGTEFGKLIGHGPEQVGKHFNHDRVPVVKGQSIAAYDPRAINGMAVTYATSPMGGDHTAGFVVETNLEAFGGTLDRFSAEGQVEASRNAQIHMVLVDTVGICDFAQTGFGAPDGVGNVCKMVVAKSGKPFSEEDWTDIGKRVLQIEVEFNRKAGFTKEQDRLPKMFYEEPLPPYNKVVVISDEEMDTTFNFFKE